MDKLVSIITPCFNGEQYISRCLNSILIQSYTHLELIIINDGSNDKTGQIILSYRTKFEKRGIAFIYLYQENGGQSSAINLALSKLKGDYIAFIDSDDIMPEDAIEQKVAFMENNPNVGLAINKIKVLDYDTLQTIGTMERTPPSGKDHLFADLITGQNVFYTPGGYFWRTSMFIESMPKPLQIAAPREIGQNFQLILPIAYKYPIGYIDRFLYYYLVRPGSHSRTKHTYQQSLHNWEVAKVVLNSIANDVEPNETKRYHIQKLIDTRFYRETMELAYKYKCRKDYKAFRNNWVSLEYGDNRVKNFIIVNIISVVRKMRDTKSFIVKITKAIANINLKHT